MFYIRPSICKFIATSAFGLGGCGSGVGRRTTTGEADVRSALAAPQNSYRTPSFIASGSRAAMTRSALPVRSENLVTAFELKRL